MALSQSFDRLFTVDEANELLPTLRPLIKRIFRQLEFLKRESEVVIREEGLSPGSPDLMERLQKKESIARRIFEIKALVEKIHNYGCVCKGVEEGLVDFPCLLGEEIVFLCWRYGEESITYWHRIQDGFAGRKPLLESDGGSGTPSYH